MSDREQVVLNGRYELHRRVGRGGMAEVYLARDRMLDRLVAINVKGVLFGCQAAVKAMLPRKSGSIVNVAGAGIVNTTGHQAAAEQFVDYLLSQDAQQYFADETAEYPLTGDSVTVDPRLKPLDELTTPDLDLSRLEDLQGTLTLLQETGALQ